MKRNKYIRIVLDEDLLFLKSLNGVGVVFNRVFREIFREIRGSGTDSVTVWNSLVEGRVGIRVSLEMWNEGGVKRPRSGGKEGTGRRDAGAGGRTVLDNLVDRVRNFELGGGDEG